MNLLLVLLLLQDRPIEASVEAFINGEPGARVELLKRGPRAIPALLKVRDRKPGAVDEIHAHLRQSAAYPAPIPWGGPYRGTTGLSLVNLKAMSSMDHLVGVFNRKLIPICSDRFDGARLKNDEIRIDARSPQEFVEGLCRETGLDYGYFHNFLVIGLPDRLWSCRDPAKVPDLDAASRAKALELIEKLGAESVDVRESATRDLVKFGRSVIPILEGQRDRKEREIAVRSEEIIIQLRATAEGAFGPAACLRQKLSGKDQELLNHLQATKPVLNFENTPLADVAAHLKKEHDVECVIAEPHRGMKVTLMTSGQSHLDALSVITQARDLDFVIQDRKVVIDSREAIEKLIRESK